MEFILRDHMERKNVVVLQRQYRRFSERRRCYRFRVVANAVVLRNTLKKTPGRVLGLDTWSIEEELQRLLDSYRKWNPKNYYRFLRSKTPEMVIKIRQKRERNIAYLHQREEEEKEHETMEHDREEKERR